MSKAFWFWLLVILWALSWLFGTTIFGIEYRGYASNGLLLILFGLVGWKLFGPPING